LGAFQAAHFLVLNLRATLPNPHGKAHDGVRMNAGDARDGRHAAAFCEHGNHLDFLFGFKDVCHSVYLS
jgi:hypothetical protein